MNKPFLNLLLISTLFLIACNKDDNDNQGIQLPEDSYFLFHSSDSSFTRSGYAIFDRSISTDTAMGIELIENYPDMEYFMIVLVNLNGGLWETDSFSTSGGYTADHGHLFVTLEELPLTTYEAYDGTLYLQDHVKGQSMKAEVSFKINYPTQEDTLEITGSFEAMHWSF